MSLFSFMTVSFGRYLQVQDCHLLPLQLGELGSDRKGEFRLMKNRKTKEHVAVRYVSREVSLHGCLAHRDKTAHLLST